MSEGAVLQEKSGQDSFTGSEIDLWSFHEHRAGRLILDPACVSFLTTSDPVNQRTEKLEPNLEKRSPPD